jgi:hypothetical protein
MERENKRLAADLAEDHSKRNIRTHRVVNLIDPFLA